MAANEGFRRVYLIGKAILAFGVLLDVFLIIGLVARALGYGSEIFSISLLGIPFTLLGLAILAIGWVAEGFSRKHPAEISRKAHSPGTVR